MLLKMMLGVMCITGLAYVVIRYGLKRFLPGAQQHGAMQVLLRQPIEPKRSLLMVRVASRHLLLASSESGITLLTELTDEDAAQMLGKEDEPVKKPQISREFSLELDEPVMPPVE
jgi:flagellar biogenesis protein FliO